MEDVITGIQVIVVLITILGFIPYGFWIIYSACKKNWKRVRWLIAIPVTIYSILIGGFYLCDLKIYSNYLQELYDTEANLGDAIFEYNSPRSFHGDGYSFSVYELPASVRNRFESADYKLLSEFPKHPSYRNHWKFEPWRRTPFDEIRFKEHLKFVLIRYDSDMESRLISHHEALQSALKNEGAFYALFFNTPTGRVGDIDFFVVDLIGDRLYLINHNT